MNPNILYR